MGSGEHRRQETKLLRVGNSLPRSSELSGLEKVGSRVGDGTAQPQRWEALLKTGAWMGPRRIRA